MLCPVTRARGLVLFSAPDAHKPQWDPPQHRRATSRTGTTTSQASRQHDIPDGHRKPGVTPTQRIRRQARRHANTAPRTDTASQASRQHDDSCDHRLCTLTSTNPCSDYSTQLRTYDWSPQRNESGTTTRQHPPPHSADVLARHTNHSKRATAAIADAHWRQRCDSTLWSGTTYGAGRRHHRTTRAPVRTTGTSSRSAMTATRPQTGHDATNHGRDHTPSVQRHDPPTAVHTTATRSTLQEQRRHRRRTTTLTFDSLL